jgi:hypothetical protein
VGAADVIRGPSHVAPQPAGHARHRRQRVSRAETLTYLFSKPDGETASVLTSTPNAFRRSSALTKSISDSPSACRFSVFLSMCLLAVAAQIVN